MRPGAPYRGTILAGGRRFPCRPRAASREAALHGLCRDRRFGMVTPYFGTEAGMPRGILPPSSPVAGAVPAEHSSQPWEEVRCLDW